MLSQRRQSILTARQLENRVDLANPGGAKFPLMKKSAQRRQRIVLPSPGELRLLQILWRIGRGTIEDTVKSSCESPPPNYMTVQTLLRIMERRGQVDHSQDGRSFVFSPLFRPSTVSRLSILGCIT